ncbi:MAG: hypothetical protein QNI86_08235 [Halieaceae bacterium]|nr:hypothetical protein [Halieaceae bacterium]
MRRQLGGHFLLGLLGGLLLGTVGLLLAAGQHPSGDAEIVLHQGFAMLPPLWEMAVHNLRGSIVLFLIVLLAYARQLSQLHGLLAMTDPPLQRVVRHEQLLDLCASLFFGIGVIWTAIGMRDALLFALGEPGSAAQQGAFAVLQRMVDGGILLALSTTIVGGIGGYLMRAGKSIWFGEALASLYMRAANEPGEENLAVLRRIEEKLESSTTAVKPVRETL